LAEEAGAEVAAVSAGGRAPARVRLRILRRGAWCL